MVVVVGGEGDAVGWKVGVGVELAGVEGREVSGQALPSQQGDVAEQLVNLTIGNSSDQWQVPSWQCNMLTILKVGGNHQDIECG